MEREGILGIEAFVSFLEIDKNASFMTMNQLDLLGRID
jgi:hypothetical protein